MADIIIEKAVERRAGYLYFVDGEGNICSARMVRGGGRKKKLEQIEDIEDQDD